MLASQDTAPRFAARSPGEAAEAARYALLRRLGPSMRHHLVVNLQPIGMIYEVLDRRLRAAEPKLESVRDSAQKIHGFARAALDSVVDVVGWLAPDDTTLCELHECARECASLLASSLSFRGYTLRNEVAPTGRQVRRSALRHLLAASLIHVTDELPPPMELVLAAEASEEGARLTLSVRVTDGDKGFVNEPAYRPITFADLRALADAEGAGVTRTDDGTVRIVLPWAA